MVKIGDTIYQYSAKQLKMITNADFSKISLLKMTTETNLANKIEVLNVKGVNSNEKDLFQYLINHAQLQGSNKKLVYSCFLRFWDYSNGYSQRCYYYQFYCEKKNWRGKWVSDSNARVIITNRLKVYKNWSLVFDQSAGVRVYDKTGYSGSFSAYTDFDKSNLRYVFNDQISTWERSGGCCGISTNQYIPRYIKP